MVMFWWWAIPGGAALLGVFVIMLLIVVNTLLPRKRKSLPRIPKGRFYGSPFAPKDASDVIIVGAGPAGSTAAFFLKTSNPKLRVTVLEKETFPRDKICGEAWCSPALDILDEMGLLTALERERILHDTATGGFVSPSGDEFIDRSGNRDSTIRKSARTCSIPRIICDMRMIQAAVAQGAKLEESCYVTGASFDKDEGMWVVRSSSGAEDAEEVFRARMLLICDGSNSFLATKLGLVKTKPTGFCTRQYWLNGTHKVSADGILLYPRYFLPGYMALFKHHNGNCYLGSYMLPGGSVTEADLIAVHRHAVAHDEIIRRELGPEAVEADPIKVGPIRIRPCRSYAEHLLIVGDAAGQVDPMTGEGIHTAMIAAKRAASVVCQMFDAGNFTSAAGEVYHSLWWDDFGFDSQFSEWGARLIAAYPWLLDAMAAVAQAKGKDFMVDFGEIMTGVKPKVTFLHPRLAVPLGLAVVKEWFRVVILRRKRDYCSVPYESKRSRKSKE